MRSGMEESISMRDKALVRQAIKSIDGLLVGEFTKILEGMTRSASISDAGRRKAPLVVVNAESRIDELLNLLTALQLNNSHFAELDGTTRQASTKALRIAYGGEKPSTFFLLTVWNSARRTYVPYISDTFNIEDEEAQRAVLTPLLSTGLLLGATGFQISAVGDISDAVKQVASIVAQEVLEEIGSKLMRSAD